MDEIFDLPVLYNDRQINFPARLLAYGYSYKIEVDIKGTRVYFEPDEERNWRALVAYEETEANKNMDRALLETIALAINEIVK
jgi:hypothetical protein